jgi:hypothetical protein
MGNAYRNLTPQLIELITAQPLFFVATAPLAEDGHVNISPKGLDAFRVLSPTRVAYLDITGSGNETAAHVSENGRITLMWCSFGAKPTIVRVYGRGWAVLPGEPHWEELRAQFPEYPGVRQIITVDVELVRTSCGFGVPMMELVGDRGMMQEWAERKGPDGLAESRMQKNATSLDGLSAPMAADEQITPLK